MNRLESSARYALRRTTEIGAGVALGSSITLEALARYFATNNINAGTWREVAFTGVLTAAAFIGERVILRRNINASQSSPSESVIVPEVAVSSQNVIEKNNVQGGDLNEQAITGESVRQLLDFGKIIADVTVEDISTLSGLDQIRWMAYVAQDGSQRMKDQLDSYILVLDQALEEEKPINRHAFTLLKTLQAIYDRTHNPNGTNETDLTFADVLQIQRLLRHDVALFGTILSNKVDGAYPWMSETELELLKRGKSVFNPDNGKGVIERDETGAIENESNQLTVGAGVKIINYEQQGGGVSLSEIVDMLISLRETALAAIVNFQGDGTSIDEKRARIVAHTVLRYMTSREGLDVRILNSPFDGVEQFPLEEILREALEADTRIQTRRKQARDTSAEQVESKQFVHKAVLIGSSKPGDDMNNRAALLETLHQAYGDSVVDTFNPNFDGPNGEFDARSVEANMYSDLEAMNNAEHIVVYIGRNTLAQFATLKTALWFSLVNGSRVTVCVSDDIEGSYAGQTAQSHLAELTEQIPAIQDRLLRIQTPSQLGQVL